MKRWVTILLMAAMALSLAACGQSEAAADVDNLITAIGDVTLDSEGQIAEAEAALDALEETDRKQVKQEEALTAARMTYETLSAEVQYQTLLEEKAQTLLSNMRVAEDQVQRMNYHLTEVSHESGETYMRRCAAICFVFCKRDAGASAAERD